jgi:5-methyltetrahydropteroyltriglutamate--homocysteine methyltransferase
MSLKLQEVGSLPKPIYLLWANRKRPLNEYQEQMFSSIPSLKPDDVKELAYSIAGNEDPRDLALVVACMRNLIKMNSLNFDYIYTGEMHRIEMYEFMAREFAMAKTMQKAGTVRSFEDKFYTKYGIISQPDQSLFLNVKNPYLKEFELTTKICKRLKIDISKLKVPMTGPYTMVNWSYLWHDYQDYEQVVSDYVSCFASVLGKWAKELVDLGCTCIQIDEPAATTMPAQMSVFNHGLKVIHNAFLDLKTKPKFIVHICYSDWKILIPFVEAIKKAGFSQVMLELSSSLKRMNPAPMHKGWVKEKENLPEVTKLFEEIKRTGLEIGLGILDVHTDIMEEVNYSAELAHMVTNTVDEEVVWLNPDCGLRTRKLDIADQKLELLSTISKTYDELSDVNR